MTRVYQALGLMSGTSLDGVDVALIETDGRDYVCPKASFYHPYPDSLRAAIRACFGLRQRTPALDVAERDLTDAHAAAVQEFARREAIHLADIDIIGFHGQTITHDPGHEFTWQIGDGARLAAALGRPVAYDFRSADVKAGGQGAPLLPLYHRARSRSSNLPIPCAILNIGGVSNITWIGAGEEILAFDCGPGNAFIDDAILAVTGARFDKDGALARAGQPDHVVLNEWMRHPFFAAQPPKSLDRQGFDVSAADRLPIADRVATLTAFTVQSIGRGLAWCPEGPRALYISGGGRHNEYMMESMRQLFGLPVLSVDTLGWNGDAVEAEGFAYLAVRVVKNLPLSLPTTTGCPHPITGGVIVTPP